MPPYENLKALRKAKPFADWRGVKPRPTTKMKPERNPKGLVARCKMPPYENLKAQRKTLRVRA